MIPSRLCAPGGVRDRPEGLHQGLALRRALVPDARCQAPAPVSPVDRPLHRRPAAPGSKVPPLSVASIERRLSGLAWGSAQRGQRMDRMDRHIAGVLAGIRCKHARPPALMEAIRPDWRFLGLLNLSRFCDQRSKVRETGLRAGTGFTSAAPHALPVTLCRAGLSPGALRILRAAGSAPC